MKYYYDEEAANRAVNFIEQFCTHVKGELAGLPFILEQWQKDDIVRPLFGWKDKKTGLRQYRFCYVEIPRKNGKSNLAAALILYLLFADGEPG
jgi:phage terminase large subunit-like protein